MQQFFIEKIFQNSIKFYDVSVVKSAAEFESGDLLNAFKKMTDEMRCYRTNY